MINHVGTFVCPVASLLDENAWTGKLLTSITSSTSSSVCEEHLEHFMVIQCSSSQGVAWAFAWHKPFVHERPSLDGVLSVHSCLLIDNEWRRGQRRGRYEQTIAYELLGGLGSCC